MKHVSLSTLTYHERFTYLKTIVFDENELQSKGAKFQIVIFKPNAQIEPHYHTKTTEIFYIQAGSGTLILNSQTFVCKSGDIFLCEPGDVHAFMNPTTQDFTIVIFKTNEEAGDIFWIENNKILSKSDHLISEYDSLNEVG